MAQEFDGLDTREHSGVRVQVLVQASKGGTHILTLGRF